MPSLLFLLLLLLPPSLISYRTPPRYRIQLDSPPSSRWDRVIDDHKQYLPLVVKEANKIIPPIFQRFVWSVAQEIRYFFPEEFRGEIEGISNRSGIPLGEVVGLNILYDITAFDRNHILNEGCTSLVACDSKGRIWHGRNLDYPMGELLKNTTIIADFYRGDKASSYTMIILLYSGTTFALYVGLLTGQRPHAFSVSLNARYSGAYIDNVIMEIITHFKNPVSFVLRETLQEESSFSSAVSRLSTVHLICPAYVIVAGINPYEGALISRDRWKAADVEYLNSDRWFFVETNFDHWTPDKDDRRKKAIRMLKKLGRERTNAERVMRILSMAPVDNDLTIYSSVLSAAQPKYYYATTVIRD